MDQKIEKELECAREGFESEIAEGVFPNVDLDQIIDGIRRGMMDVKEGRVVSLDEFKRKIDAITLGKRGVKRNV